MIECLVLVGDSTLINTIYHIPAFHHGYPCNDIDTSHTFQLLNGEIITHYLTPNC